MIAVIADDFTGAAEIGGLALKYNLTIEISTTGNPATNADLLIIAMDTRSQPADFAVINTEVIIEKLVALKSVLLFKKVDSVLRGHVMREISTQLEIAGLKKALLIPANPALGRTLINGEYFLHGVPVHLTSFAHDPEFPIKSPKVEDMLRTDKDLIHILSHKDPLPNEGVMVGEVTNENDLVEWCKKTTSDMLIAGASGFFEAMLKHHGATASLADTQSPVLNHPILLVCGSSATESRSYIKKLESQGAYISYVPLPVNGHASEDVCEACAKQLVNNLTQHNKAALAIDPAWTSEVVDPVNLRNTMARIVKSVTGSINLKELLIEGGSTAAAILQQLNVKAMYPTNQLAPGVIRMAISGHDQLHLTLKPGSYSWPPNIF